MKKFIFLFFYSLFSPLTSFAIDILDTPNVFGPTNFWECLLEEMPGTTHGLEYREKLNKCKKSFPINEEIKKRESYFLGLFLEPSSRECVQEHLYSMATPNGKAVRAIKEACVKLYYKR